MPEQGERIKTPDGPAVVIESNILENIVKTRLIIEEKGVDRPEKLSVEIYTYKKQQIKRVQKNVGKEKDIFEEIDAELLDEIKDLLKD